MIITGTLAGPGSLPKATPGHRMLAAIDVEWTKNYRIKNGNVPFCYSVVYLRTPTSDGSAELSGVTFDWTSVYVERSDETADLVRLAAADLDRALKAADVLAGHQLCSDLAVLKSAGAVVGVQIEDLAPIGTVRDAWRTRRTAAPRSIVDTRYDTGHMLCGASRRLVDVCTDLGLDVTQPELASRSMTALHRNWLESGTGEARERISVLNLRHSLSTALVAALVAGVGSWARPVNVNARLHNGLRHSFDWLDHPTFRGLVPEHFDSAPAGSRR